MRSGISFLSLSIAFFALGGCCTSMPSVQVRTWDTTTEAVYPERDDPDYKVPWLAEKHDFGVAFSGGGTRAAAATLGQLRALECLGWLDRARYVSAVSGGAWAAVPYLYLPSPEAKKVFLGGYVPPERLTDAHLAAEPERSLTRAMNSAFPVWGTLRNLVRGHGDESYTAALGDIFLRPFGLGDRNKFFSSHSEVVDRIVAANPHIDRDDFLLPQRGTPYLLVGGTLIGKPGLRRDYFQAGRTARGVHESAPGGPAAGVLRKIRHQRQPAVRRHRVRERVDLLGLSRPDQKLDQGAPYGNEPGSRASNRLAELPALQDLLRPRRIHHPAQAARRERAVESHRLDRDLAARHDRTDTRPATGASEWACSNR